MCIDTVNSCACVCYGCPGGVNVPSLESCHTLITETHAHNIKTHTHKRAWQKFLRSCRQNIFSRQNIGNCLTGFLEIDASSESCKCIHLVRYQCWQALEHVMLNILGTSMLKRGKIIKIPRRTRNFSKIND